MEYFFFYSVVRKEISILRLRKSKMHTSSNNLVCQDMRQVTKNEHNITDKKEISNTGLQNYLINKRMQCIQLVLSTDMSNTDPTKN
jgi:hypothetical protein